MMWIPYHSFDAMLFCNIVLLVDPESETPQSVLELMLLLNTVLP
ncbi:MAG: hypothetical protein QMD80_07510 [archaeon]|nr:hypothetical protein [archaeon]